MKLNAFFKDKSYGFYWSIAVFLISLATAVAYAVCYRGTQEMSWPGFVIILVGLALAVVLAVTGHTRWVPVAMAVADFIALLLYIYAIYFYVSVIMVGIEGSAFSMEFNICTTCFLVTILAAVINIFLRQVKD